MTSLTDTAMTRADFEAKIEETIRVLTESKLPADKEKLRADLLSRFAARVGVSVVDYEKMLDEASAPAPEPPAKKKPVKKTDVKEAARSMRALASAGTYFYEAPAEAAFIDMVFALNREADLPANLLITGPSGSGKSESIEHAAQRAGLSFYPIDCASVTTDDKWIGHKEFIAEKGTSYVLSDFLRAVTGQDCEPGVILLDEINRLHPTRLNILNPLLDGRKAVWVPELGIRVEKAPGVIFCATANIGVNFTGTHTMDVALAGRFGYRLERPWPPVAEEVTILTKRTGIDKPYAQTLVAIADETRRKAKVDDLPFPISTRDLLNAAALVAAGMNVPEAAEYTFVKFYDEAGGAGSPRTMVRTIVQGKSK